MYMYQHFEFLYAAFVALVGQSHYYRFTEISQSCVKHVFYIDFVDYAGNLCLLYMLALQLVSYSMLLPPIMLIIMLA